MRIKKHGKMFEKPEPIHTEKFSCENCGCEFTCKDDEYYTHFGGADWNAGSNCITATTYTISSTIRDYLVCSCPECHKIIKKVRERKNDNYWSTIHTTTTPLTWNTVDNDKFIDKDYVTITCSALGKTESSEL